jgi:hypothetical protein
MSEDPTKKAPETPITPVTPAAPPTPPADTKPTAPAFDPNALKAEIETSVGERISKGFQEIKDGLAKSFGLTKEEKAQIPTDPKELETFIQKKADERFDARMKEINDADQQSEQDRQKQTEEGAKTFQNLWARDYTEMANLKMVPPITKAGDKNDPGEIAKSRILLKLRELIDENEKNGIDYVPSLWEVMQRFPNVWRSETKTGANAPVSGGGGNSMSVPSEYDRLHNTPLTAMVAAKNSE